jgi:hypothetical protein
MAFGFVRFSVAKKVLNICAVLQVSFMAAEMEIIAEAKQLASFRL